MSNDEESANWYLLSRLSSGSNHKKVAKPCLSSIREAYAIQSWLSNKLGWDIGGWKLGGTNKWTQSQFETSSVYFGPLQKSRIFHISEDFSEQIKFPMRLAGELEVAVRLNENVEALSPLKYLKDVYQYIDCVAPSVEFPLSGGMQNSYDGVCDLVADLCASGFLVVGKSLPANELSSFANVNVFLKQHNAVVQRGSTSEIIGSVPQALFDFLNLACRLGIKLLRRQWVATGGCSPSSMLDDSVELQALFTGFPSLSFSYHIR
jgi:2-keto-4-pentenoate hydratase